jgi:hypothetical protein
MATILPGGVPGASHGRSHGWHTVAPMGRHVDGAAASAGVRRAVQVCGLVGGAAWVAEYFLDGGAETALLWVGAVFLTIALLGLGLMLVKSDVLPLRLFVALALPTLVWGVYGLIRDSVSNEQLVDAVFGALIGLASIVVVARRSTAARATL